MIDFIKQQFPHLYEDLSALYKTGGASVEYKNELYKMVNELRDQYGLSGSYSKPKKEKMHRQNMIDF